MEKKSATQIYMKTERYHMQDLTVSIESPRGIFLAIKNGFFNHPVAGSYQHYCYCWVAAVYFSVIIRYYTWLQNLLFVGYILEQINIFKDTSKISRENNTPNPANLFHERDIYVGKARKAWNQRLQSNARCKKNLQIHHLE